MMCTLPKGHTGDHIAESGKRGNIKDAFREGVPSASEETDQEHASTGGGGTVVVKGGCPLVVLPVVGGVTVVVLCLIKTLRRIR